MTLASTIVLSYTGPRHKSCMLDVSRSSRSFRARAIAAARRRSPRPSTSCSTTFRNRSGLLSRVPKTSVYSPAVAHGQHVCLVHSLRHPTLPLNGDCALGETTWLFGRQGSSTFIMQFFLIRTSKQKVMVFNGAAYTGGIRSGVTGLPRRDPQPSPSLRLSHPGNASKSTSAVSSALASGFIEGSKGV